MIIDAFSFILKFSLGPLLLLLSKFFPSSFATSKKKKNNCFYFPMVNMPIRYYEERSADDSDIPLDQCNIPEVQSLVSETQAVIMFLGCASGK